LTKPISVDMIEVGDRLRELNQAQVATLADSIAVVGLLSPITIYKRKVIRAGSSIDGYGLVAGGHRLAAHRQLGLAEISANVVDLNELERQIAECDENLCGPKLNASETAMFTRRRKEAYLALYPETAHGSNQHTGGDAKIASPDFATDQSKKTGASKRKVQLDAERGEKITTAAMAILRGTKLDNGAYLDKLKKVAPDEQAARVDKDLRELNNPKPKDGKKTPDPRDDADVHEGQVAAIMSAWNRASADARRDFMDRVDTPVMDGGRYQ